MYTSIANMHSVTLVTMSDGWALVRVTNSITGVSEYRWEKHDKPY